MSDPSQKPPILRRCGCGQIPKSLHIVADHEQPKYAYVYGGCCGDWHVEFRAGHAYTDSELCMERAIAGWNMANRSESQE